MKAGRIAAMGALALGLSTAAIAQPPAKVPAGQIPLIEFANPGYADGDIVLKAHGMFDSMHACRMARKALIGDRRWTFNEYGAYSHYVCMPNGLTTNYDETVN